jgi:hypothetical protein
MAKKYVVTLKMEEREQLLTWIGSVPNSNLC